MGLTPYESEQQSIEMYCSEYIESLSQGEDPGEFGPDNFNNWLESQGEGQFDGTEAEFLARVRETGFDPDRLRWVEP